MKIGILTQPIRVNYGGIIQNWALQQVLKSMGHAPVMINRCDNAPVRTPKLMALRSLSFVKHFVLKAIGRDSWAILCNPFARVCNIYQPTYADKHFCSEHIEKSKELYSDDELQLWLENSDVEAFIVGSDQVWRQEYSPRIETYFLDFLPDNDKRKRIAYAASFGTDNGYIDQDKQARCSRLLNRFDAVSVREDGGLKIAREVFGCNNAVKVLDPTLLLSADHYKALINETAKPCKPYVAAYILDDNNEKDTIISDVSSCLKKPIKRMSVNYTGTKMPTIAQWLATFANADFVVTDSFHGCVFSIIFEKPFIAIGNIERGLDRFTSLLGSLGWGNRLINSLDEFNDKRNTLLSSIDYESVNVQLDEQRRHSLSFLTNALA